jgi:hypothetical protein
MKQKFSPQFQSKIEKSLTAMQAINYDMEVVKLSLSTFAEKKAISNIEHAMKNFAPMGIVTDVSERMKAFASQKDLIKLGHEIKYTAHQQ